MSLISLFREARPVRRFADKPVPRELILSLLDDAVWAPNHRLREPWRFICAEGDAKRKLAESLAANGRASAAATIAEAPAALIVTAHRSRDAHVDSDDFAAVCCLIQNMQLLGWAQGVGMAWELADFSDCPDLLALTGVQADERIAGLLGLGFFSPQPEKSIHAFLETKIEIW